MPDISIIVPVLNEEKSIGLFLDTVHPILGDMAFDYEIIFVDDGSTDATSAVIHAAHESDPSVKLVRLSRNFGKEAALTAGLDFSSGEAVIPMDVDLQDPPELIVEFVRLWRDGFDVVFGQRVARHSDTGSKRISAGLFYRLFNHVAAHPIDENAGDYRLMSRKVVNDILKLRERNRFMKGLFSWVGYKSAAVPYERPARAAGETKFSYWKLWNFALDGITSFSTVPLRIWTYIGGAVALGAMFYTAIILARTLIFGRDVPGYASLMVVILTLGAVQLISLGIIGEYLGRLYVEVKQRPIYLVGATTGLEPENAQEQHVASQMNTAETVSLKNVVAGRS
ncbi:glycosyltransferase family 2 protein [Qingshengfaniella alkalisoli]|uniref:Glycosyltransferase family 2 protein n=1 Tax=Qingshengfaniella alkalisoli TaxID=2599296 RepID=A0A5B8IBV0_9RHOB|nr:glycosyltransferase family 2 protein [Qingshengfaniella alkalisoli]QDY70966.1 glycosyltransferase family 2 protein [Qingshengfaniella alkalisoli]